MEWTAADLLVYYRFEIAKPPREFFCQSAYLLTQLAHFFGTYFGLARST
ncbi:hypothetical protein N483_04070 [Pseudoalteromonas luteoviolacea NCIMB 1944]|nr:hypothetical protein N483_04070 [Pseudoalteromonas luteoviolacea NCIMB 1944]